MLRRLPLAAATALLAAGLLAGCTGGSDAEDTTDAAMNTVAEQPAEETTTSAAEEAMEESGGDVETVPYPDGWPAELPVPDCALVSAATYGTDLNANGGVAGLRYECADASTQGAALMDALIAQTTETNNLGTSGFYETDTWQIQMGYDESEILYNLTRK